MSVLRIKNVSGSSYVIEEMHGFVLQDQEEVDLLDVNAPEHYVYWSDANQLVTNTPTAKLYQDIQAGLIEVVESKE